MPDLSREGAACEEMVHGLRLLITEGAGSVMGQAVAGKAVHRPAAILHGQLEKELDT